MLRAPSTRPGRYTILEHLALDEDQTTERVAAFVRAFAPEASGEAPDDPLRAATGRGLSSTR